MGEETGERKEGRKEEEEEEEKGRRGREKRLFQRLPFRLTDVERERRGSKKKRQTNRTPFDRRDERHAIPMRGHRALSR